MQTFEEFVFNIFLVGIERCVALYVVIYGVLCLDLHANLSEVYWSNFHYSLTVLFVNYEADSMICMCVSSTPCTQTTLLSICFDPDPFVLLSEIPSRAIFVFFMISSISGMWSHNPVTFHFAIFSLLLLFLFPVPFSSQCPFPCPFTCSFSCPFPVLSFRLYFPYLSVA